MNDIEILISALEDLNKKINFDHNKEKFENSTYKSAINYALATIKERQVDKDRIKELEEYANWHIEHLTEDIADYIDDDKAGNASIIGEFKEEREHWRDINRILNNKETYIDYKNY